MHEAMRPIMEKKIQRTMKALEANNMTAYYVPTAKEVVPLVEKLLTPGQTIASGGSVTLKECGVLDLISSDKYHYLDRSGLSGEALEEMHRKVFSADCFFSSCNAVTERGELYNIDGNSTRVSAMTFGPRRVFCVVGCNKLVPDLAAAEYRVKNLVTPTIACNRGTKAPCGTTGYCVDCKSPARHCCTTVIHQYQRIPGRITVILVGEELGY